MLFGISHGNFEDLHWTVTNQSKAQERYLSTAATLFPVGPTSLFRHGLKVGPENMTRPFNESSHSYDQLMYLTAKTGFDSVLNLHTGNPVTGKYFVPGHPGTTYGGDYVTSGGVTKNATMQDWENWVASCVAAYGPAGYFQNGVNVNVYGGIQVVSGWRPRTRWEIWNEPNSPTGNCGYPGGDVYSGGLTTPPNSMALADAYEILLRASRAIRTDAHTNGWTPYIIAFGVAQFHSTMAQYWNAVVQYGIAHGSPYTIGATTYGPNPHDFCDAVGIHPYSSADPNLTADATAIKTTIPAVLNVMNANGGATKRLYLTEWGWRGHNPSNRYTTPAGASNTEWEDIAHEGPGQGSQERWEMSGVDVVGTNANTWRVDGVSHYLTVDNNSGGATNNLGLFYDPYIAGGALNNPSFPGPIPDQYMKAVGLAYRAKLLAPPVPTVGIPVGVVKKGHKIRIVET